MNGAFTALLRLFPREFRERFGSDMHDVFRDQLAAARKRAGTAGVAQLWLRTTFAITRAAILAHRDARLASRSATANQGDPMLDRVTHDIRFSFRMLRKSPVFAIVAVLAISLGSGAVTTIFSAMNSLVLRPLPGATNASRLVSFQFQRRRGKPELGESYLVYEQIRNRATTLNGVAAWRKVTLSIAGKEGGYAAAGHLVSGNYFDVLGVRPQLGRFFLPDEDRTPLTHPVVVLSNTFWTSKLGADSSIVGRSVTVNGNPYTVIGVAPPGFVGVVTPIVTDAWIPLMMTGQLLPARNLTTARWLRVFARLKDGVATEAAQSEISTIAVAAAAATGTEATTPETRKLASVRLAMLRGIPEDVHDAFLGFMALLLGAATLVLMIASVNVASLLSARVVARRREMALRAALGAGRGRLIAQLLTEVLVLFALGAVGGIMFAFAATRAAALIPLPTDVVAAPDMSPDWLVMSFALGVSLLTGLMFGILPALRAAQDDISARLRDGSAGSGTRRTMAGNAVIVGQLALSLVLLVAAGLFLRALSIGQRVDPGFDRTNVSVASFNAQTWGYDSARVRRFYRELRDRIATVPGVTDVGYASFAPITTRSMNDSIRTENGQATFVWLTDVDGGYFSTLRLPIIAGRAIASTDDERSPRVVVINETLARKLAPGGNALGRTIAFRGQPVSIVGIARDAKYADLAEDTPAMAYFPSDQSIDQTRTMLIKSGVSAAQLGLALRDAIRALDPVLPRPAVTRLEVAMGITLLPQRIAAIVTAALGGVGLLLATLGLYGIIAYSVNRRTREMGIRVALGARRQDVIALVVREGMRLATIGVAVGLVLAAAAARLISGFLFDVSTLDPVTFAGMSALFMLITLAATLLPARRAAGANPMSALREE